MSSIILTLLVFSPLVGVLLLLFVQRDNEKLIKAIGLVGSLIPLILAFVAYGLFDLSRSGYQLIHAVPWFKFSLAGGQHFLEINYELGIDGLSLAFIMLVTILSVLAALASFYITKRWKEYFIFFFLLEIGMLGVFASLNLFLFFIFFEITIIAAFFLIGIWGYQEKERAAYHFLIYNGIGSAAMLIAFILIYVNVGTLNLELLTQLLTEPGLPIAAWFTIGSFVTLFFAFGVKLPVFPLHSWMLRVHVQAPPGVVMIHSGVLLKLGAYGLIRLNAGIFPQELERFSLFIAILGLINILYGAILAFRQNDLKRVLAYSSLSHMGIVLFGIAALNESGLNGAVFQSISHGLISALLFFVIAVIYDRTKSSMISDLGGLAKTMPILCGVFLAAGMANLGLPGMSGFISEFLSFLGIFNTYPVVAAIGVLGIILTAVYMLRAVLNTSFGPLNEELTEVKDVRGFEYIPLVVLLGLIILIGLYPAILGDTIRYAVESIAHGLLLRVGG